MSTNLKTALTGPASPNEGEFWSMAERRIRDKVIRLIRGDITDLEVEAFVYDLREDCKLDSGYGGAIAQRGGKVVQDALDKIGSLPTGNAVITTAGEMKATYIIHTNGPKFNEPDTETKLTQAMESVLRVANENGIKQLAMTPIGTGLYQVPMDLCVKVMVDTVAKHLEGKTSLKEVTFVGMDPREYEPLQARIQGGA